MQVLVIAAGLSLVSAAALPQFDFGDFESDGAVGVEQGSIDTSGDSVPVREIPSDFAGLSEGGSAGAPSDPRDSFEESSPDGFSAAGPGGVELADSQFDSFAATGGFNPAEAETCKEAFLQDYPNVSSRVLYISLS